jgi:hypothetical protein
MSIKFIKDTVERAVAAFIAAYLGVWVEAGSDFDALANAENLKVGAVAAVAIVAAAFGLKKVGPNKDSGSIL